jgi:hypothetical protein
VTGVYQRPPNFSEIVRERLRRRREAGLPIGRPRKYVRQAATCACGKSFEYKLYPGRPPRICCGCRSRIRRKLPYDAALLTKLYWGERKTTEEIAAIFGAKHSSVRKRMAALGIARRPRGHSRLVSCIEPGCNGPLFKIRHAINGSFYGRRCFAHWVEHRAQLGKGLRLVKQSIRQPAPADPEAIADSEAIGSRELWCAVIEDAIALATGQIKGEPDEVEDAEGWLRTGGRWPTTFLWACQELGLDPAAIRRAVQPRRSEAVA